MGGRMNDAADAVSAVKVSKLVKRYGDMLALDYFDLDVHQGEIFGLLGPNGSGKTTAINCILALLTFDEGTARVRRADQPYQLCVEAAYRHCAAERGRVQRIDR